jgi:hypothetical protein
MSRTLSWLAPYETDLPTVFKEYLHAVPACHSRQNAWVGNRSVLREKDELLEAANQQFRNRVFDTCWALIDRFPKDSNSTLNE